MYIQVNIGRNVGDKPLEIVDWESFQNSCRAALYQSANGNFWSESPTGRKNREVFFDAVEYNHGSGTWENGVEESCHISVFWEYGFDLDNLRELLKDVKDYFGQDNIALIIGSELI